MTDFLDDDAVDLWLLTQRRAVLTDLTTHLDVEAGLRETLIPMRHADLVRSLHGVLDLEAGLAAIVPSASLEPPPPSNNPMFSEEAVVDLIASFKAMPLLVRLELRHVCTTGVAEAMVQARWMADAFASTSRHSFFHDASECYGLELSAFEGKLKSDLERIDQGVAEMAKLLSTVLVENVSSAMLDGIDATAMQWFERGRRVIHASVRRIESARQTFGDAVQRRSWQLTTTWLSDVYGAARTVHRILDHVARELLRIEQALNNFTGEDFRAVDLDGIRLAGLRWSTETQWPEAWREQIEHDSFPIGDGIFEIRGGTSIQHDALV
jgi:hypothetical protein